MPNKPRCRYRLLKSVRRPETVFHRNGTIEVYQPPTLYYLEQSVRLFGLHLWWKLAFPHFFDDHEKALQELRKLCGRVDFEFRQTWIKENCV